VVPGQVLGGAGRQELGALTRGACLASCRVRDAVVRPDQLTPSFFCSDDDEVVYWNSSFFPGCTILYAA
jgi:hypothetical protein